ncbi:MAG: ABC transporter permease [Candidatus Omnitrophota bacterium]|nr:ABC transporter permease [Candidatus Omnitrophota bacterium]
MKMIFWIAWRYLWTKRKERFVSLISVISILGVAIGVAALIIVLAVMSGFDKDLKEKIIGNYSHIVIEAPFPISDYTRIIQDINKLEHISASAPFIQNQVFLEAPQQNRGILVRGIDLNLESRVTDIERYLGQKTRDFNKGVFIGKELSGILGLEAGDELTLINPEGGRITAKISGLFNSGMYDYDTNIIYMDLAQAQDFFGFSNSVSGISVKVDKLFLADALKAEIQKTIGPAYNIKTWIERNKNFFAALKLEKITMFIILTLIILVAAFNIISTLVVMVTEKTKDIGILKAVGMTNAKIRAIFTLEGLFIGLFGCILGSGIGITLSLLLKKYQFVKLPPDIYYLDRLPVSLVFWPDVGMVIIAAFLISLVSTIYPARKAGQLNPLEALRYE